MRTYSFIQLADESINYDNGINQGWEYAIGIQYPKINGYICSNGRTRPCFGVARRYRQSFELKLIIDNQWTIFK